LREKKKKIGPDHNRGRRGSGTSVGERHVAPLRRRGTNGIFSSKKENSKNKGERADYMPQALVSKGGAGDQNCKKRNPAPKTMFQGIKEDHSA